MLSYDEFCEAVGDLGLADVEIHDLCVLHGCALLHVAARCCSLRFVLLACARTCVCAGSFALTCTTG